MVLYKDAGPNLEDVVERLVEEQIKHQQTLDKLMHMFTLVDAALKAQVQLEHLTEERFKLLNNTIKRVVTSKELDIHVYSAGVASLSVCYSKCTPLEDVTECVNREYPTGISSQWAPADSKTFATGEPNPCPCNIHPDTRIHRLFHC